MIRIPMCGDNVRALLNTKVDVWPAEPIDPALPFKWQTRRLVKPQPPACVHVMERTGRYWAPQERVMTPLGIAFAETARVWMPGYAGGKVYAVGEALVKTAIGALPFAGYEATDYAGWGEVTLIPWRWKTKRLRSITMPLEAARLWVRVSQVRPERVRPLTLNDAIAEGYPVEDLPYPTGEVIEGWWQGVWDGLNAKPGTRWADNPWVWAYEIQRVSKPDPPLREATEDESYERATK